MQKIILCFIASSVLLSCNSKKDKTTDTQTTEKTETTVKAAVDLPYTASYTSNFSQDVSDADLKTVLMSYKDWADANMDNLKSAFGDSLDFTNGNGDHKKMSNAGIMQLWQTYRDSLSSVSIDMYAWTKVYATDKKESYILTWYMEKDTYKNGKIDSAEWHDINQVKDGKIIEYSQYKRPFGKK